MDHDKFFDGLLDYVYNHPERYRKSEVDWVSFAPGQEIILCEEPLTFLSKLDDYSNNQGRCRAEFKKLLKRFKRLRLEEPPGDYWFNTTKSGINLRPGLNNDEPRAIQMGDNGVHGLMAGQTGSGKSAMLNNLIFNLLAEYPPWELDLYLADFKKVEFSRYMNKFETPHVSACAATSEIRYVISMIQYMVDCMNARESLFARLGYQKLADLREGEDFKDLPPFVLPRMLLIVDEFQQLFLEASPKEAEQIRQMLTAIVKKGRATGLHILFASQEMSNTLSRSDLANFKIRFALNCNVGVSMDVIGNREATNIRKGSVIYNTSDGNAESNVKFLVPYVKTDIEPGAEYSYFDQFLARQVQAARMFSYSGGQGSFKKPQKFYQEDLQDPFLREDAQEALKAGPEKQYDYLINQKQELSLEEILERIREHRKQYFVHGEEGVFEVLTLGKYVTFANMNYDIQTLFLEYGRNKNILAVSPKVEDLVYLERLLSYNFQTSPRPEIIGEPYHHQVYSFQPGIKNQFPLEETVGAELSCGNPDDFGQLQMHLERKKMMYQLCQDCDTPYAFAIGNYRANLARQSRNFSPSDAEKMEQQAEEICQELFGSVSIEEIPQACQAILDGDYNMVEQQLARNLMMFYEYRQNIYKAFPPTVVWVIGIDSVERVPEWLMAGMKNSLDYHVLFIVMANSEFDQMAQMAKCCDYIFAGGNNARIYDRLQINYTHKEADSIVLDLNIRSMDENRSFKKYKCRSFERKTARRINFDQIIG